MNMHHIWLIIKREYVQRIKNPGFIIGTVLGMIGILGLGFLPALLNMLDQQSVLRVAVVDPKNLVLPYLPVQQGPTPTAVPEQSGPAGISQSTTLLTQGVRFSPASTDNPSALDELVKQGKIDGYLLVEGTRPGDMKFTYHSKDRPSQGASSQLLALLNAASIQARLHENGVTPQQTAEIFAPASLKTESVVPGGMKDEKTYYQSIALVYVLLILLYATMLMYGIQVAMGVVEEKSSRVIEILMTSVRPIELMIGKVLGIGAAGATQYGLWVVSGFLLLGLSGAVVGGAGGLGIDIASVPAGTLVSFLVFFLLGYVLYATIYAGLGSLVNRSEEVNSITTPITLLSVGSYLLSMWALTGPDSDPVRILSFVPFFTPMLMFTRVALSNPGLWEVLLSIVLLLAASLFFAWIAAKIYRVGLLLYGKRPSFREIGRLLRTT